MIFFVYSRTFSVLPNVTAPFILFRCIYCITRYVKNGFTVDLQCTGTVKGYGYVATLNYRNALGMLYVLTLEERGEDHKCLKLA